MNEQLYGEFKHIYKETVDDAILRSLVNHIESILLQNEDKILLKTRNPQGKHLGYFSIEGKTKSIPVIFAGARDPDENRNKRPSIRFRENTDMLAQIRDAYKYPSRLSRKENWVCVEINRDTVNYLLLLMDNSVNDYMI
jgi:hypothetical protein